MSHAALTQRYRPQTFADVAGQTTLKAILSRASAEDMVAPAYLFSGTRGVGKTTIARIFAKALNCKNAPGAEPCNHCENCRAIAASGSVDVVEIDGASHTGVDDIRSLKENVGYAPMDGRYKIFIIDEAHMLSKSAFNALLKTLEEPPARVTFIMATTEPHKFPPTIISRCQHYVFKRLSDAELEAHLTKILGLENLTFEPAAVRLIVRRAAGSVRDAMSLLGQVLALGGESLNEADTRMVLGLAGQELFFKLLSHIKVADCPSISLLVREMLDQGLDLGFFLRELSSMWRNLFMLRQAGEAARGVVDLPKAEVERWLAEAITFEIGHIHAAWQMSLEGQRRVLTSLEPALALELLLLNLAMLPKLLSMEQISLLSRKFGPDEAEKKSPIIENSGSSGPTVAASAAKSGTSGLPAPASGSPLGMAAAGPSNTVFKQPLDAPEEPTGPSEKAIPDPMHTGSPDEANLPDPAAVFTSAEVSCLPNLADQPEAFENTPLRQPDPDRAQQEALNDSGNAALTAMPASQPFSSDQNIHTPEAACPAPLATAFAELSSAPAQPSKTSPEDFFGEDPEAPGYSGLPKGSEEPSGSLGKEGDWESFVHFCSSQGKASTEIPASLVPLLNKVTAVWENGGISITPPDIFSVGRLEDKELQALIKSLVSRFCGCSAMLKLLPPPDREADKAKLRAHLEEIPAVKALQNNLGAQIIDYAPWRG